MDAVHRPALHKDAAVFTTFDDDRSRSLRRLLFIRLSRPANGYFQIPAGRAVEVGTQVMIQGASS